MNKHIALVALATLALATLACDTTSEPGDAPLLAADFVDVEDAEQMVADGIDGAAALAEAVELTADVDEDPEPFTAYEVQEIANYCFSQGPWNYSGQCIDPSQQLVPNFCIVLDSSLLSFGHAIQCASFTVY